MRQPKGYQVYGKTRVAVNFSPELFERIKRYATRKNILFSDAVARFCAVGLDRIDALEKSQARIAEKV